MLVSDEGKHARYKKQIPVVQLCKIIKYKTEHQIKVQVNPQKGNVAGYTFEAGHSGIRETDDRASSKLFTSIRRLPALSKEEIPVPW